MRRQLLQILSSLLIIAGSLSIVSLLHNDAKKATELPINEAISKIDRGDFKEARFTSNTAEFTDYNEEKFVTTFASDATRDLVELKLHEFMEAGPEGKTMKITVEPASATLSSILFGTAPFALLFIGIGLALGLLLSRFIRK